jgi:hypothetical protein
MVDLEKTKICVDLLQESVELMLLDIQKECRSIVQDARSLLTEIDHLSTKLKRIVGVD